MKEMNQLKAGIIGKITESIKTSLPYSDVNVYGSHATQLCLHWSDIDLVLIPPNGSDDRDNWMNPLRTVY